MANKEKKETLKSDNLLDGSGQEWDNTVQDEAIQKFDLSKNEIIINNHEESGSGGIDSNVVTGFLTSDKSDENKDAGVEVHSIFSELRKRQKLYRKCSCEELRECLFETFQNFTCAFKEGFLTAITSEDTADLMSKCSLKKMKNSCSFGQSQEYTLLYDYFEEHIINLEKVSLETYSSDPNAVHLCTNQKMSKCFLRKSCFVDKLGEILVNSTNYCMEKIEKLAILDAFKLKKDDVIALKNEYFEVFDEDFQANLVVFEKKYEYSNFILTQWFYQWHKRLCYTLE